jgi:hypothetical protein
MCPHERLLHYCGVVCASGVRVRRARHLCRVVRCHASACTSHCVHVTGHAAGAALTRTALCRAGAVLFIWSSIRSIYTILYCTIIIMRPEIAYVQMDNFR